MPLTKEQKIEKFKISADEYSTQKSLLHNRGYEEGDINKVILRSKGVETATLLISLPANLIQNFSHKQIIKIVSPKGGSKNLAAVQEKLPALTGLGFNAEQVVRIASHDGGSKNLAAVQKNLPALLELGFNAEQVVRMASHGGGSHNLAAAQKNLSALTERGFFTTQHVVRMASHKGGSKNLAAVQKNLPALTALRFNAEQVVRMVSHGGGSKNLAAVQKNLPALTTLGFNPEQVVRMVSHIGGSHNLAAVQENLPALTTLGFKAEHVVRMVSHIGGSHNLAAVQKNFHALTTLRFNAEQVVRMVSHDGGSHNLAAVQENLSALTTLGFKAEYVVRMVSHNGGSHNLAAVKKHYDSLMAAGSTREKIINYIVRGKIEEDDVKLKNIYALDIPCYQHPFEEDTVLFNFSEDVEGFSSLEHLMNQYPGLNKEKISLARAQTFARYLNKARADMLAALPENENDETTKIKTKKSLVIINTFSSLCAILFDEKAPGWMATAGGSDAKKYPVAPPFIKNLLRRESLSVELAELEQIWFAIHEEDPNAPTFSIQDLHTNDFPHELTQGESDSFTLPTTTSTDYLNDAFENDFLPMQQSNEVTPISYTEHGSETRSISSNPQESFPNQNDNNGPFKRLRAYEESFHSFENTANYSSFHSESENSAFTNSSTARLSQTSYTYTGSFFSPQHPLPLAQTTQPQPQTYHSFINPVRNAQAFPYSLNREPEPYVVNNADGNITTFSSNNSLPRSPDLGVQQQTQFTPVSHNNPKRVPNALLELEQSLFAINEEGPNVPNSFLQSFYAKDLPPQMTQEEYYSATFTTTTIKDTSGLRSSRYSVRTTTTTTTTTSIDYINQVSENDFLPILPPSPAVPPIYTTPSGFSAIQPSNQSFNNPRSYYVVPSPDVGPHFETQPVSNAPQESFRDPNSNGQFKRLRTHKGSIHSFENSLNNAFIHPQLGNLTSTESYNPLEAVWTNQTPSADTALFLSNQSPPLAQTTQFPPAPNYNNFVNPINAIQASPYSCTRVPENTPGLMSFSHSAELPYSFSNNPSSRAERGLPDIRSSHVTSSPYNYLSNSPYLGTPQQNQFTPRSGINNHTTPYSSLSIFSPTQNRQPQSQDSSNPVNEKGMSRRSYQ